MMGLWCFPPSSVMGMYRSFWGLCYPYLSSFFFTLELEAVCSFETLAQPPLQHGGETQRLSSVWTWNPERIMLTPFSSAIFSFSWSLVSHVIHISVTFTYLYVLCLGQYVRFCLVMCRLANVDSSKSEHIITRHSFSASNNNVYWLTSTIRWYGFT